MEVEIISNFFHRLPLQNSLISIHFVYFLCVFSFLYLATTGRLVSEMDKCSCRMFIDILTSSVMSGYRVVEVEIIVFLGFQYYQFVNVQIVPDISDKDECSLIRTDVH